MQIAKNTTIVTKKDIKKMQYLALLKSSWIVAIFAVVFVLLAFRIVDGKFVFESVFFAVLGAITIPLYLIIVIRKLQPNMWAYVCSRCRAYVRSRIIEDSMATDHPRTTLHFCEQTKRKSTLKSTFQRAFGGCGDRT